MDDFLERITVDLPLLEQDKKLCDVKKFNEAVSKAIRRASGQNKVHKFSVPCK